MGILNYAGIIILLTSSGLQFQGVNSLKSSSMGALSNRCFR